LRIKRIGFTLIRVHRRQTLNADQTTAEVLLQQLKWPIEVLFVGMKIKDYNSSDVATKRQHLDKWHTFTKITPTVRTTQGWKSGKTTVKDAAYSLTATNLFSNAGAAGSLLRLSFTGTLADGVNHFPGIATGDIMTFPLTSATTGGVITTNVTVSYIVSQVNVSTATVKGYIEFTSLVSAVTPVIGATGIVYTGVPSVQGVSSEDSSFTVAVPTPTFDTVTIKAHGIPIYNGFSSKFYNAYIPYHFGGPNVGAPTDTGALMIPFCLYPGSYQPSGHINVSRAREFYLEYTSSVINTSVVGTLVVTASAINFLLIDIRIWLVIVTLKTLLVIIHQFTM